jgi:hypothetical protein
MTTALCLLLLPLAAAETPREARIKALEAITKAGGEVTVVKIANPKFGDADLGALLEHLQALPELRTLDLSETRVTIDGVLKLKELKQLQMLGVPTAVFKDPAIKALQRANKRLGIAGPVVPVDTRLK